MRGCVIVIDHRELGAQPDTAACLQAAGLRTIAQHASLAIYAEEGCSVATLSSDSWVIGNAFIRTNAIARDPTRPSSDPPPARAKDFMARHWGDYVLLVHDAARQATAIGLSPFFQGSLFSARTANGLVLASSVALLRAVTDIALSIDWDRLASFIAYPEILSAPTCLRHVDRILAGSILAIDEAGHVDAQPGWCPWDFVRTSRTLPVDHARNLEATIDHCVAAWSSRFQAPLLELSGGLDSSILAASLVRCRGRFASATMVPDTADGNELAFARTVSDAFGLDLRALKVRSDAIDVERVPARLTAEPGPHLVAQHFDDLLLEIGRCDNVDIYLNGAGGDNVFARMTSAAAVVERQRSGGAPRDIWQTVGDVTRLTASTYLAVLRNAARRYRRGDGLAWTPQRDFVTPGIAARPPTHPWVEGGPHDMPAKARQVRALVAAQGYGEGQQRPLLFPLLSQPIVELCLAIPSWAWIADGVDRAVARQAYRDRIPEAVRTRRSKGALDGLFAGILRVRRQTIRELLLDGLLVRHGLLDRAAIEEYTRLDDAIVDDRHYRIIELLGYELWARAITA